jgi:hypothetical protein
VDIFVVLKAALSDNQVRPGRVTLGNLPVVLPSAMSQDRAWTSRVQDGVRERLGLTWRHNQHGASFNRPLRSGFGAVEYKIGYGASFQIGRSLYK